MEPSSCLGEYSWLHPATRIIGFRRFCCRLTSLLDCVSPPEESRAVILGGIELEHLESRSFDKEHHLEFQGSVQDLPREAGLIPGSSCGLYKPEFLDRINLLYELVEDEPRRSLGQ